jgi:hypothetical protein
MNQNKKSFAKILLASIEPTSCDTDRAKEYLIEQGLDPEAIRAEGAKRIKRLQMLARAEKTRKEMAATTPAKQQAMEWVEQLLNNIDFSFPEFVRQENLVLQNRNIDSFAPDDVRETLVQYFYLKFVSQGNAANK